MFWLFSRTGTTRPTCPLCKATLRSFWSCWWSQTSCLSLVGSRVTVRCVDHPLVFAHSRLLMTDLWPVCSQISLEAVRSLGLLLEGWEHPGRPVQPVHRLLSKGPLQMHAGYSALSHSFPLHQLISCLQHNLALNPFGITSCLRSGKKLAWAQQSTPNLKNHTNLLLQAFLYFTLPFLLYLVEGAMKRAKIARNTHMAPAGSKMVLMSQVCKQTLAKTSDKMTGANIKIHRCVDAFIYLLSPLRLIMSTCNSKVTSQLLITLEICKAKCSVNKMQLSISFTIAFIRSFMFVN